eukprot:m.10200 g.10200  ORF g.10200 m.10200 type:complete len:243 (+) comp3067_c0_seq1:381-1109(+)
MRLNDRHVAHCVRKPPINQQGWLWKRGFVNTAFKKRFFKLKGNLLFYFKTDAPNEDPIGVLILEGATVISSDFDHDLGLYTFQITFSCNGSDYRVYTLGAKTQEEEGDWVRAIKDARYDVLRIMVQDLEQRVAVERARAQARRQSALPSAAEMDYHLERATAAAAAAAGPALGEEDEEDEEAADDDDEGEISIPVPPLRSHEHAPAAEVAAPSGSNSNNPFAAAMLEQAAPVASTNPFAAST